MRASRMLGGARALLGGVLANAAVPASVLQRTAGGITALPAVPLAVSGPCTSGAGGGSLQEPSSWPAMPLGARLLTTKAKTAAATGKEREGEKPKKALSGYNLFTRKAWEEMNASEQKIPFSEASKLISEKWKALPEAEKEKLRAEAEKGKPPPKPKGSLSSFAVFVKDRVPELKAASPGKKATELMKVVSTEWKSLPEAVKSSYKDKAEKLKGK
mmetsp:Transcript_35684/g.101004  ORF Transcript_35684/g.101004 Transcript_35684/m.101004 type:complete len:215 (+) Transcript_35684:212-856(+)|eukprot:CAMPEP_0117672230 /NCGR_PEP_ID=MMETSP0804-20121206/13783_1 /TAXON_ID=1074897 /ORGANISM="Tetraselmis astigmatica, Strain CCMP880" /LENGTH=214 /DNA_ID=CAMNT_0005480797 /DNA_START=186 /DNA_END=830 /DNA_ORIENTATION=-